MKKIKKIVNNNIKIVVAVGVTVVVMLLALGGVYAATVLASSSVSYDPSASGLNSSDVQSAIDELSENSKIGNRGNIVEAYTYDETSYPCATGTEAYCVRTDCYESSNSGSCPVGTIIYYKVNDTTVVPFNVIQDNGSTMIMQSQKNVAYNVQWADNYNTSGPLIALEALEKATAGWTNVNQKTTYYGCSSSNCTACYNSSSCTVDGYTLSSRTSRARLITVQELFNLGCLGSTGSCPKFISDYLYASPSGRVDSSYATNHSSYPNKGYWAMNSYYYYQDSAYYVNYGGYTAAATVSTPQFGVRAVVTISK